MQFCKRDTRVFRSNFSKEGSKPDPKRVDALKNAPVPKNISEVLSLLGMANYSAKYIPNFATITAPLRNLTKKNTPFTWTDTHQNAFRQLTNALASAPCCLILTNRKKHWLLHVDASPVGVSAILSQKVGTQCVHVACLRNGRFPFSAKYRKINFCDQFLLKYVQST